jgi:pimeloyl-ACP methyl ester carboxylesterase
MTPRTAAPFRPWLAQALAAGLACVAANGSAAELSDLIIQAPNLTPVTRSASAVELRQVAPKLYTTQFRVPVSPHPAELAVAVLEPGDYHLQYELGTTAGGVAFTLRAEPRSADQAAVTPKGTIVLLHGIYDGREDVLHWSVYLAERGYRTVAVDLRGHGASTGAEITYGAWEKQDLSQVLDELAKRRLVSGKVGVLGISYGAAVGIQWAAADPRIEGLVALAPFSDTKDAIRGVIERLLPPPMLVLLSGALPGAIEAVAPAHGFTWNEADPLAAATKLRQPLLLIHGVNDDIIPFSHSERLQAVAPRGSQLLRGTGNHVILAARLDPIAERVASWFERAFAPAPGPSSLTNP